LRRASSALWRRLVTELDLVTRPLFPDDGNAIVMTACPEAVTYESLLIEASGEFQPFHHLIRAAILAPDQNGRCSLSRLTART
jgi:hypothetical protein